MTESLSFNMILLCAVFVSFVIGLTENISIDPVRKAIPNDRNGLTETTSVNRDYYFDPQITGFNNTEITSGPLVLADTKNVFISNIQYKGAADNLIFCVGRRSPYSDGNNEKQCLPEKYFEGNHSNLNIELPENFTLDLIDFIAVSEKNPYKMLDYVFLKNVNKSTIRKYNEQKLESIIYRFPKCCQHSEYLNTTVKACVDAQREIHFDISIFESNETGLDPDVKLDVADYELRPFYQELKCKNDELRVEVSGEDIHGLIYNSSLIIKGTGILSHGEFCIDMMENEGGEYNTSALYCYHVQIENSDPNLYLPVLIVSAVCFAASAVAYGIILKVKDIHKRCLIVFSSSMCVTCLCLIILQAQSNNIACNMFGFVFLFSITSSFSWLLISCLELLYLVKIPFDRDRNSKRWYWYIGSSFGVSTLMTLISAFSGEHWIPDVPGTFIKNYDSSKCRFSTAQDRACIIFVPMILSIILSLISVLCMTRFINKNEKNRGIKNHYDWVANKNAYKFLSRTYFIIIIVSIFWLLNAVYIFFELQKKAQLGLEIIEASFGIVTMVVFVLNKYTWAEIKEKLWDKPEGVTEERIGLNGIHTPETPAIDIDDPFIQNSNRNTHLTTFGNNR